MTEPRIISSEQAGEDGGEASLRPQSLNEFIGQAQLRSNLGVFIEAARARGIEFRPIGGSVRDYLSTSARALVGGAWAMAREAERYLDGALACQFEALPEAAADCDAIAKLLVRPTMSSAPSRKPNAIQIIANTHT